MKISIIFIYLFLFLFILLPKSSAEGSIKINEFLAHPSSGNKEWVEFYNPDHIDLSGYFLDDDTDFGSDTGNSSKKNLATINNDNPLFPYFEMSSFLNNSGDYVVLFSSTGELIDKYQYTKDPGADIAIGRFPDGTGEIAVLSNPTKGQPNSAPHIDSPTPSPSPKPTPTHAPTKITSTKSSTKVIASSMPTQKTPLSNPSSAGQILSAATDSTIDIPTSVLGQSTKSAAATSSSKVNNTKKEAKALGSNQNNIFKILIGAGSLFVIACAILFFRYFKNKESNGE